MGEEGEYLWVVTENKLCVRARAAFGGLRELPERRGSEGLEEGK